MSEGLLDTNMKSIMYRDPYNKDKKGSFLSVTVDEIKKKEKQFPNMLYNVNLEKLDNFDSRFSHWWIQMGVLNAVCSILDSLQLIKIIGHQISPIIKFKST